MRLLVLNPTYISLLVVWLVLALLCIGYALLVPANIHTRLGAATSGIGLLINFLYYVLRATEVLSTGSPIITEVFRLSLVLVGIGFLPLVGVPLLQEITKRDKQWREK